MDELMLDLSRNLWHFFTPLYAGCAIAAIVKLRGSPAAVLGGVGFGLLFLTCLLRELEWVLREPILRGPPYLLVSLAGLTLVFVALLTIRRRPVVATEQVPAHAAPAGDAARPAALPRRPGWGMVAAWIVLSSLAWIVGIVWLGVLIEAGSYHSSAEEEDIIIVSLLWIGLLIPAAVVLFIWLYETWDAVPPRHRSATPGAAVGLLFIPFFDFYWVFRAVPGLSASIRRARRSVDPAAGGGGFGVGVAACVVMLIPYVNVLSWILFLIWVILANVEKNRMLRDLQAPGPEGR